MEKREFNELFKQMAIELSESKGSVKAAASALGIASDLLSKWRGRFKRQGSVSQKIAHLSEEQQQIKRLEKQLKALEEEQAILKKAVSIFVPNKVQAL